jgi:hypothetical protein
MQDDQRKALDALKETFRQERAGLAVDQPRRELPIARVLYPLLVILGIAIVLVPIGFGIVHLIDAANAAGVVQQFCKAETDHNYDAAYQTFSQPLRSRVTKADLIQASDNAAISYCDLQVRLWRANLNGNAVTEPILLIVGSSPSGSTTSENGEVDLVRDGLLSWKIDGFASSGFSLP